MFVCVCVCVCLFVCVYMRVFCKPRMRVPSFFPSELCPCQGIFYFVGFICYGVSMWYAAVLVRESNDDNSVCIDDPTTRCAPSNWLSTRWLSFSLFFVAVIIANVSLLVCSGCFSGGTAVMAFFSVQLGMEQASSCLVCRAWLVLSGYAAPCAD